MDPIPFNWPTPVGRELEYLRQAAASGHLCGDGPFTKRCEALLQQHTGAARALLTTSCTHALDMSALLMDVRPGDEVIVPSFTFVSTANAFVLRGATPVFADIRPDTLNLDERLLPSLITPRTKAIALVHYAGIGCEMDDVLATASRAGVAVVEDNAHGLLGRYKGRPLGSFGALATLSFHDTKNFMCGEGGALLVNDAPLISRAEILREKGTNRSRFFRGEVDKYSWVDVGSSYVLSELLAAFLLGQLEEHERIQAQRRRVFTTYASELASWAGRNGVALPHVPAHCDPAWHMFWVLLPDLETRGRFIAHLKAQGIHSVFHYLPLHLAPMAAQWRPRPGGCPVAEQSSDRLARLPFFTTMTEAVQARVIDAVTAFAA
ncbi:MAG TPA: dTDP-4-amino-4,6-dideoxygalactose transaminase [Vicinamibacterales bacterium]|nr:dTDP-4-amino-4,6-dideoxygalactose transaminase [Vicinamibacterales bacterium]